MRDGEGLSAWIGHLLVRGFHNDSMGPLFGLEDGPQLTRRQEVGMLGPVHRTHADYLSRDVDCCSDLQFPT